MNTFIFIYLADVNPKRLIKHNKQFLSQSVQSNYFYFQILLTILQK